MARQGSPDPYINPHLWGDAGPVTTINGQQVRLEACERPGCRVARVVRATPARPPLGYLVDGAHAGRAGQCGGALGHNGASRRRHRPLAGPAPPVASPTLDAIVAALAEGPLHLSAIEQRTGLSKQAVSVSVSKLGQRGLVRRLGAGRWERA